MTAAAEGAGETPPAGGAVGGGRPSEVELAVAAAGIGVFSWDLRTGAVTADARVTELFGVRPSMLDPGLDALADVVHPRDLVAVRAALLAAIEAGTAFRLQFRLRRPDGGPPARPGGSAPGAAPSATPRVGPCA